MSNKKGFLVAGLLGVIAGAASILGLSKIMPKVMEKCCEGMKDKCCGGHETEKTSSKKRKK